jgi:iron complex transport system substrate-binding protein
LAPAVFPSVLRSVCAAALLCAAACAPSAPSAATDAPARDAPATRIVSLAPAFTETLIALGATDRVVAIGRFDPDVPGRADLPRLGDSKDVNLESLSALAPDAVLVNAHALAERLSPLAAQVRVIEMPTDRLEDALTAVTSIARLTQHDADGAKLVGGIRESLAAARRRASDRTARGEKPPRVLVVVQRDPYYTAGKGSFLDDLITAVGAENVFGDVAEAWPMVSEESIVARAPQVVLDASVGDVDTDAGRAALARGWQRFQTISAVRDGRVHVIREDAIFRAGPRIPEGIAVLERLLYGEGGK